MKVMIRRTAEGLSAYVPKKDLEEAVVEQEHESIWGGWIKLRTALCLSCRRWQRIPPCLSR